MTKVSILVPVFNGDRFLQKCLDSLFSQTYKDIEIICVNDGSTDHSVDIIEKQMAKDARIKLVEHEGNKGLAVAWNTGVSASTGDIIGFLDSDDWYDADTIEKMVDIFDNHEDADCVLYRCIQVDREGNKSDLACRPFKSMDGKEAFMESLNWGIHGVYAGRAELFRKYPVDTTRRHFSNDNTTRIHYYMSRKVYQSDAPYYYLYNPNSISNQVSVSRMDYLAATESMKRQLLALNCTDDIIRKYETERVKVLVDCYLFYYKYRNQMSKADKSYCLNELKTGWESIEPHLADKNTTRKLGYNPCKGSWKLFRLQEELYFFLKKMTGRT